LIGEQLLRIFDTRAEGMMSYNFNIQFYASFLGKKFSQVSVIIQISMTCFYLVSKH